MAQEESLSSGYAQVLCQRCDEPMHLIMRLDAYALVHLGAECSECHSILPLQDTVARRDTLHLREGERTTIVSPAGHRVMASVQAGELAFYNESRDNGNQPVEPMARAQGDGSWRVVNPLGR